MATNNPKFEGIKQGWNRASQADESTNCSENVLKQILTNTENLLNNSDNEKPVLVGYSGVGGCVVDVISFK